MTNASAVCMQNYVIYFILSTKKSICMVEIQVLLYFGHCFVIFRWRWMRVGYTHVSRVRNVSKQGR